MKLSQNSARDMLVYELGNMFTARLGLEELIPLVISKCREILNADGVCCCCSMKNATSSTFPMSRKRIPKSLGA